MVENHGERFVPKSCWVLVLPFLACWLSGCGAVVDDSHQLAALRQQLLLVDEPDGVTTVLDAVEQHRGSQNVVVVGRIGGVPNPWTDGHAAFVLIDPTLETAHGHHDHCDEGCPFCAKGQAPSETPLGLAVVRFLDQRGELLPIDARRLFDLREQQMVVVRGRAEVDASGCLSVAADGLYKR